MQLKRRDTQSPPSLKPDTAPSIHLGPVTTSFSRHNEARALIAGTPEHAPQILPADESWSNAPTLSVAGYWLVLQSWLLLLRFEYIMKFRGLLTLRETVRRCRISPTKPSGTPSTAELCHAMNLACVFYFKKVLCLQYSAATTVLLRRYGWKARMVTGAQVLPVESHAWVEVDGVVVNDKPYMHEIYQELERY